MTNFHIIPQNSVLTLYKDVDISSKYRKQVVHQSKQAQENYFQQRAFRVWQNVSVMRNSRNTVKIGARQGTIDEATYLSFRNPELDNRTYYCYITNIDYLNNDTTQITFEIDYFQTYYLDAKYSETQIVREHLSQKEYVKAIENPFDRSLISLRTPEDLVPDEEMYTLLGREKVNDGESTGSQWLPASIKYNDGTRGDTKVIVMFVAPFNELSGSDRIANGKSAYTSKYGNLTFDEVWEKFQQKIASDYDDDDGKTDGKISAFGLLHAAADGFFYNLNRNTSNPLDVFSIFNISKGIGDNMEARKKALKEDYDREKQLEKESKNKVDNENLKYKSTWEQFLQNFGSYCYEGPKNGGFQATRMFIFKGNKGYQDFQSAVDFMTLYGYSSSIVGAYYVPLAVVDNTKLIAEIENPCKSRHPKLRTFPYTYINVISPDGTNKEYKFENFAKITDKISNKANFTLTSNFNGVPTMSLVPLNYKMIASGDDVRSMMNYIERITFRAFPPVGWTTDSFLTYLNKQNTAFAMQQTPYEQDTRRIQAVSDFGKNVASSVGAFATGNPLAAAQPIFDGSTDFFMKNRPIDYGRNLRDQTSNLGPESASNVAGGYLAPEWQQARPAFVNKTYHASGTDGWEMYQYWGPNFRIDTHTIHPQYLHIFERYFDLYGYNTKRIGVPHLISWIHQEGEEPHWEDVDGKRSTYLKTYNIQITNVIAPAIEAISSLLDGGCSFVKGS